MFHGWAVNLRLVGFHWSIFNHPLIINSQPFVAHQPSTICRHPLTYVAITFLRVCHVVSRFLIAFIVSCCTPSSFVMMSCCFHHASSVALVFRHVFFVTLPFHHTSPAAHLLRWPFTSMKTSSTTFLVVVPLLCIYFIDHWHSSCFTLLNVGINDNIFNNIPLFHWWQTTYLLLSFSPYL